VRLICRYTRGGERTALSQCIEALFNFAVEREAPSVRFREDQASVNQNIELPCFAGLDLRNFAEAIFQ
jgi:hypothetical protein